MYREEYPNPQFERETYECLNGEWEFEIGTGEGKTNAALAAKIEVPFCPESRLSGIGKTELFTDCIYARDIEVRSEDLAGRLFLHFGAVDHLAKVYVNGRKAGCHAGGYTAFSVEITPFVKVGKNRIAVCVHDDVRENLPSGKQVKEALPHGCFYTRVTGIWQTVWLERTPEEYIKSVKFYPDIENCRVKAELITEGEGHTEISVLYQGRRVGHAEGDGYYRQNFDIELSEKHLWELGQGRLYDVIVRFGRDQVKSYFGLREVRYEGRKFLLNGRSVFQRLVLDQGYYPDGHYTAPSIETMRKDIQLGLSLGFNGARLHQKVFEQRFLYECDRAGYMVWGEYASWGVEYENLDALGQFINEWRETVDQHFNHPSVITWCPLNETWENLEDKGRVRDMHFPETVYAVTKLLDPTRPCVDVSGGYHGRFTDLFDFHCYHTPEEISGYIKAIESRDELIMDTLYAKSEPDALYDGTLPLNASEYGGVAYVAEGGWGYRTKNSEEEFVKDYVEMTRQFLDCGKISGFCYTQLYDVQQEQNGLFTYDRRPKLSEQAMQMIASCNRSAAEVEKSALCGEKDSFCTPITRLKKIHPVFAG